MLPEARTCGNLISKKFRYSMFSKLSRLFPLLAVLCLLMVSCQQQAFTLGPDLPPRGVINNGVAITLRDQKMTLISNGKPVRTYDISSSKFGNGGRSGTNHTPVGIHAVTKKIGDGQPLGMVFKGCRPTGEIVPVDARGRDPIVTRVIQIAGLERGNSKSFGRRIYIHGTPEERKIGRPASYGCIRMRSRDIVDLYARIGRGTPVVIETCSRDMYLRSLKNPNARRITIPANIVATLPTDDVTFRPVGKRKKKNSRARSNSRKNGKGRAAKGKKKPAKKPARKTSRKKRR